ncbi:MAG: hypothetical protein ACP5OZ_05120 [Candidatus Woesearchaeota archaeon]
MFGFKDSRDEKLKKSFSKIKEEMEEHLNSINQNTQEIQSLYDYIYELESKIDKLNEKIEELQVSIMNLRNNNEKQELNLKEQEIFLMLYTEKDFLEINEISERTGFREEFIISAVKELIKKGVPIIKREVKDKQLIKLDDSFREIQAKAGIIKLSQELSRNMQNF